MRPKIFVLAITVAAGALTSGTVALAQATAETPPSLVTPDKVQSSIGTLEFKDGAPSDETVQKVNDAVDFNHALSAYLNSYGGASAYALGEGFRSLGAEDNSIVNKVEIPVTIQP